MVLSNSNIPASKPKVFVLAGILDVKSFPLRLILLLKKLFAFRNGELMSIKFPFMSSIWSLSPDKLLSPSKEPIIKSASTSPVGGVTNPLNVILKLLVSLVTCA